MITITTVGNVVFRYTGKIEIDMEDEGFITIHSTFYIHSGLGWGGEVWDKFFPFDVKSIIGSDDESKYRGTAVSER